MRPSPMVEPTASPSGLKCLPITMESYSFILSKIKFLTSLISLSFHKHIQVFQHGLCFFPILECGATGLEVPASTILHRYLVYVVAITSQLCQYFVPIFGEVHPNVYSPQVCHGIHHSTGNREWRDSHLTYIFICGVDVSNIIICELNPLHK